MRRAAILVLSLILLATTACSVSPPATDPGGSPPTAPAGAGDEKARIGFGAMEFERAAVEPIIAAFNQANPDVQVEFVPIEGLLMGGGAADELLKQLAQTTDTFPSFFIDAEAGGSPYLANLRPLLEADPTFERDDFQTGALQPDSSGAIWVLPSTLSVQTLSYNRELWEAAGLATPEADWSWGDLLAAAEQLTERQGDETLVHGLDDGQNGGLALAGLLVEAGVPTAPGADGAIDLDRPEAVAALERVADLIERGVLYQRSEANAAPAIGPGGGPASEGRIGMWVGGDFAFIGTDGPAEPSFAVEEAALPPLPREAVLRSRGYVLSAGSANPQAAWRWLSYLSRQTITQAAGVRISGGGAEVPARKSVAEAEDFWEQQPPARAAAIEATLAGAERLAGPVDELVRAALEQALLGVMEGARADQALAEAAAALDQQLAERSAEPAPTADPIAVQLPEPTVVPAGATTISFGALGPSAQELRRLAEQFNAQGTGVYVEVEPPGFGGRELSMEPMLERYDCFAWPEAPTAEEQGQLRDLQPLIDADRSFDQSDYPAAVLAPFRADGALYGLPRSLRFRALNYNRDAFAAAGLAEPSGDWELADLLEAARQLTDKESARQRYGYAVQGPMPDDLLAFLGWQGAAPVALAGGQRELQFTDEAVVQAIEQYLTLLRDYSPHTSFTGYRDEGGFSAVGALAEDGLIGMWYSSGLERVLIRIGGDEQAQRPDIAIAPPPLGRRGLSGADFSSDALLIAATSANPEACWEWIKFLSGQSSGLGESFPARTSVATSEEYVSQARPGAAELYAAYSEALADPASAQDPYAGVDLFWFFQAVDRAMQGGDLERELADARTLTEQYLACVAGGEAPSDCAPSVDSNYAGFGPR
jgi:ABC-type glycerol-3-phosphate transport system substrate-binding protein